MIENFEKLGAFYLGKGYDLAAARLRDDLLLYDAKDLTTHAICVGMTGSGSGYFGLCRPCRWEEAHTEIAELGLGDVYPIRGTGCGVQARPT